MIIQTRFSLFYICFTNIQLNILYKYIQYIKKSIKISCRMSSHCKYRLNVKTKELATVAQIQRLKDFCNPSVTAASIFH